MIIDPEWETLTYGDVLKLFAGAGFFAGMLPLLQAHSYVAVAIATVPVALLHIVLTLMKRLPESALIGSSIQKLLEVCMMQCYMLLAGTGMRSYDSVLQLSFQ